MKAFNMKKILLFCVICIFILSARNVKAVTTTPSPTTQKTSESLSEQISNLKDKIASHVAELKIVEKRGFVGSVSEVSDTQLTVMDLQNITHDVDVDEITKFTSNTAKDSFGISDITKGTKVSVIGLYNKQSKRTLARFIKVVTLPIFLSGTVVEANKDDFTLKVIGDDNSLTTIDVENVTKTSLYSKDTGEGKGGFSKIQPNDRVIIMGYPDKKEKKRMVATRILILTNFPKNPRIVIPDKMLQTEDTVPSTGSGKKLTPIR